MGNLHFPKAPYCHHCHTPDFHSPLMSQHLKNSFRAAAGVEKSKRRRRIFSDPSTRDKRSGQPTVTPENDRRNPLTFLESCCSIPFIDAGPERRPVGPDRSLHPLVSPKSYVMFFQNF
jgi:hypothetical protein